MSLPVSMTWQDVLFCHWSVAPEVVEPLVPAPLTVDTVDGRAWVAAVAFRMVDLRWQDSPFARSFPELNVRTYVTHEGTPGTYFFGIDAPDRLAVTLARLEGLPYYLAETRLREREAELWFGSRRTHDGARPARFLATYAPEADPGPADPGSIGDELVGRTRFFCVRDGDLRTGEVHRDRFDLAPATVSVESNEALPGSIDLAARSPDRCWYAAPDGMEVRSGRLRTVDAVSGSSRAV